MDTDLKKIKPSFHRKLFFVMVLLLSLFLLCFVAIQYYREKMVRAEYVNYDLQIANANIAPFAGNEDATKTAVDAQRKRLANLRVTVIDTFGNVVYESDKNSAQQANHINRPEVQKALKNGSGYEIERLSESTNQKYFYSASKNGAYIVRSALPYSLPLKKELQIDNYFIWLVFVIALAMLVTGYAITRSITTNIRRLREFAAEADKGNNIENLKPFPRDELGDISYHIVQLYSRLQHAEQELRNEHKLTMLQENEKNRIKKQLTQNINHELKTPVSSIQGYLETILRNPEMTKEQATDFIEKSYAQSNRLSSLLKDVATLTRLDEAGSVIEKEPINITEIIREIQNEILLHSEILMRINTNIDKPIIVNGNASLLQSIFRNLTDNAVLHSGGRDLFINLIGETEKDYTFSVSDNGIGVDDEHLPHIFERFYRVDKGRSRKLGGTGLGLSIVKNAVIFHGGNIVAKTNSGGGLEFIFNIVK